jgi:hypothetical protein
MSRHGVGPLVKQFRTGGTHQEPRPHRDADKREYDRGDFRTMARANDDAVDREDLRRLAGQVGSGGPEEVERYLEIALGSQSFPR